MAQEGSGEPENESERVAESVLERRRREIVAEGRCAVPLEFNALEQAALEALDDDVFDHIDAGAGTEATKRSNREAFARYSIVPRILRDVSRRDLGIELFRRELEYPLILAPVGSQSLYHDDGELATAAAAAETGVSMAVSTGSSTSLEEIAERLGETPKYFQLYWPDDLDVTASLVERAEAAGYAGIMVTVDSQLPKWRPRNLQNRYNEWSEIPKGNYVTDPVMRSKRTDEALATGGLSKNTALTWDDLGFLEEHTSLPILLKGVLHSDDARKAVEYVDGIVVSNHGGRGVDGAIGSLEALENIVDAVDDEFPIVFDSGIRSGADVFKALALGASAVMIGRPYLYGLAIDGQRGVTEVVENYLAELECLVGQTGHAAVDEIDESVLAQQP